MTMRLIRTITVGATPVGSIDFTSIPQDASDLVIVASLRNNASTVEAARIRINGITTDNYINQSLNGNGTSVGASNVISTSANISIMNGASSNSFSNSETYILNYASNFGIASEILTTTVDGANSLPGSINHYGLTASIPSAISSISIFPISTAFVRYSTVSLYGVTAGSDGTATAVFA